MKSIGAILLWLLLVIVIGGVVAFVNGLIVWGLWNWVIVSVFSAKPISYLMAVGLAWVLNIIAGLFRGRVTVEK